MKKPTPSEWARISKQLHSMSDVITAGYVHMLQKTDDDDDFGTADLSGYKDDTHFIDALRYTIGHKTEWETYHPTVTFTGVDFADIKGFPEFKFSPDFKISAAEKTCTCGTQKTYGKVSLSMHSSWCDLRN